MIIDRALSHVHSLDELARRDTPVGRLDARAKVLVAFIVLVTVASFGPHDLLRPLPLSILLVTALSLGDVPLGMLGTRLAWASPFAILVGIWNPWFDPQPLLQLGPVTVSAGWVSFLSIVERFLFAVAAVLILLATTGFDAVATALGRLGMPRVLVTQLLLLYRYSFVLGAEASRILRAYALRAPSHPVPTWAAIPSLLGGLLLRSLARAERVHTAMLCRGFDGQIPHSTTGHFGWVDLAVLLGAAGFCGLVRYVSLPLWLAGALSS